MSKQVIQPELGRTSFDCPYCDTRASQEWRGLATIKPDQYRALQNITCDGATFPELLSSVGTDHTKRVEAVRHLVEEGSPVAVFCGSLGNRADNLINVATSQCHECRRVALWCGGRMIWPSVSSAPQPHEDLPSALLADYQEAAAVLDASPRSAAALLRLLIGKLCTALGAPHNHVSTDIQWLVDNKDLQKSVQQMLDTVRVIGNDAVHEGEIKLDDDRKLALSLFTILNMIVQRVVTDQVRQTDAWSALPASQHDAIATRDAKAKNARNAPKK